MQWLLHGQLTPAVRDALVRHEQKPHDLAELELSPDSTPQEVLKAAGKKQWEILTTDQSLVQAPYEQQIPFARCIVFLQLEGGDVEQDDAIDRLFDRYKRLTPGRLYTVTASRVKIRQLPNPKSKIENPKLED
jgi:hypothetical protein